MKTLTLVLLSLIFISCEKSGESASSGFTPSEELASKIASGEIVIEDGDYTSYCIDYNGRFFLYDMTIENYEIILEKKEMSDQQCNGMKSSIVSKFNIINNNLDFVESEYTYYTSNGGDYICDQSQMLTNTAYNIDGINCEESLENFENVVTKPSDELVLNEIDFYKI